MFPAAVLYLTAFYSRKELAVRFGFLAVSGAVAGAVGGLLAYAIGYMDDIHGLRAWRWHVPFPPLILVTTFSFVRSWTVL